MVIVKRTDQAMAPTVGGIVLCGGQSLRMGRSKACLPFAGQTMLARIVRIVRAVVHPVVIVAAPKQEVPMEGIEGTTILRDEVMGRGPLQGLAAGLKALHGQADAAYVSSCDVPFLEPAFIRRLIDLLGDHSICVPFAAGFHHPLAAVYRLDVLAAVEKLLAANRLRPAFLFAEVPTRVVCESELRDVDPDLKSLWNLNTPEEYEMALREGSPRHFRGAPS